MIVKKGDAAYIRGDPLHCGEVDEVRGPEVYVAWNWRDSDGIERSEYFGFRVYGLTFVEQHFAWEIDPGVILR